MTTDESFEETLIHDLEEMGALLTGHFVLTSSPEGSSYRRHSGHYVNKDAVSSSPLRVYEIADAVSHREDLGDLDIVTAPAVGGIVFGSMMALALETQFAYAEPDGEELVFKRGFDNLIKTSTRVLIVEDIITSGETVSQMISAVQNLGGEVAGVVVLWQRGEVDLGDVKLISVVKKQFPAWDARV